MENKSGKRIIGKLMSAVGTGLIVIVIALCSLLVLPGAFGFRMYDVLSGSMEPEMPVGSLIYVEDGIPEDVQDGDIIAFYGSQEDSGIITHRVVKNNVVSGTFQTKGDANAQADPTPVHYDQYIGSVVRTIPRMGKILTWMTSPYGKVTAVCVVVIGVALNLVSSRKK